ncbi:MAG TPA: hypothetical protein DCM14_07065 [Clostridiales bacterium UBA8153]|nr:hypothetical protein [Clostridiales bacterium UBA8153]
MKRPDVLLHTPAEARRVLAGARVQEVAWSYTGPPGQEAPGSDARVVRQRWREGVLQLTLACRELALAEPPQVREAGS